MAFSPEDEGTVPVTLALVMTTIFEFPACVDNVNFIVSLKKELCEGEYPAGIKTFIDALLPGPWA